MTVYTVGHSTRPSGALLPILRDAGVELIADVRAHPGSRRHPQYNREALARWLPEAGIAYRHMPRLGGRRKRASRSPNGGWRDPAFRAFADHMGSEEFRAALAELEDAARERVTAIMCAEAVWWRCHRRLIADALLLRGWRVEHLGVGAAPTPHELPAFAIVGPGGEITYPPRQGSLIG